MSSRPVLACANRPGWTTTSATSCSAAMRSRPMGCSASASPNEWRDAMTRVLIADGQVIDGSGAAAYRADVLVEDDRIVDIRPGIERGDADVVLDASDRVVAPGFVDLHTHFDAQVFFDPM